MNSIKMSNLDELIFKNSMNNNCGEKQRAAIARKEEVILSLENQTHALA